MTKIAIYGDSFAADFGGWPSYLQELTQFETKTFGLAGSSVGYSYLKFLETHERYDQVYFFWTELSRSCLISTKKRKNILEPYACIIPSTEIKKHVGIRLINEDKVDKNLTNWFISENRSSRIYPNKNLLNVLAMRDSVKLHRPDSINIDTFDFAKVNKNQITSNIIPGMWRIQIQDMIQYSKEWLNEIPGKKHNHLTKIQNQQFANYLFKHYQNKNFDIHETFKNPLKYYTMSKSLEESGFILQDNHEV